MLKLSRNCQEKPSERYSPIEHSLEVEHLLDQPDVYVNVHPLWKNKRSRGAFGGSAVGLTARAAEMSVMESRRDNRLNKIDGRKVSHRDTLNQFSENEVSDKFLISSCHCTYINPLRRESPFIMNVNQVSQTSNFATRYVQATQDEKIVFIATFQFSRYEDNSNNNIKISNSPASNSSAYLRKSSNAPSQDHSVENPNVQLILKHSIKMPEYAADTLFETIDSVNPDFVSDDEMETCREGRASVFLMRLARTDSLVPGPSLHHPFLPWYWSRSKGPLCQTNDTGIHLAGLLYISDSNMTRTALNKHAFDISGKFDVPANMDTSIHSSPASTFFRNYSPSKIVLVSLDHNVYIHDPLKFRLNDWFFTEHYTPWGDHSRALVFQRIFTREGILIASCIQEVLIRLSFRKNLSSQPTSRL